MHKPVPVVPVPSVRSAVVKCPLSLVSTNTWLLTLWYVPVVGAAGTLTATLIVQEPFGGNVPPEKLRLEAPATGVKTGVPHPVVEYVAGVATTIWPPDKLGRLSVKLTPLALTGEEFVVVKVRLEVPPGVVVLGEKVFVMFTEVASTM